MKFAIAANILAQTLPVVSEKARNLIHGQEKKNDLASILSSISRKPNGSLADLQDKRWDQGRRKAQAALARKRGRGSLSNESPIQQKACDPTSKDPDVGILSCGSGMVCKESADAPLGGNCIPRSSKIKSKRQILSSFGKHGILKNAASRAGHNVAECDPTSGIADVGILSCGEDHSCVENKDSSMGGFCRPISTSRKLVQYIADVGLCDPSSPDYLALDCDCSGFDNNTGTGTIPCSIFDNYCLGYLYPGCQDTCIDGTVEYTFSNFTGLAYGRCFDVVQPADVEETFCFEENFDTATCTGELNGDTCACEVYPTPGYRYYSALYFDCTEAGGGDGYNFLGSLIPAVSACFDGNLTYCSICPGYTSRVISVSNDVEVQLPGYGNYTCYEVSEAAYFYFSFNDEVCSGVVSAAQACCGYFCSLCGPQSYIPYENDNIEVPIPVPGYEGTTCYDLATASYTYNITEGTCGPISGLAQQFCCEEIFYCYFCDDSTLVYPLANVAIDGYEFSCFDLELSINDETECSLVTPLVSTICCGESSGAPSPTPVGEMSGAPVLSPVSDAPTGAPEVNSGEESTPIDGPTPAEQPASAEEPTPSQPETDAPTTTAGGPRLDLSTMNILSIVGAAFAAIVTVAG